MSAIPPMVTGHDALPRISASRERTLDLTRSNELLAQARRLVPGVTQSMMKRPEMFCMGSYPVFLQHGTGTLVRDVDGNEYIDYVCGLGANTLGHQHPAVLAAIERNLQSGILHSLPTEVELLAARELTEMIPGAEMVRFFKTGADATSSAVRLARYTTGKQRIVTVGYNGWHDHFMFDTPGVPEALKDYTFRMPLQLEAHEAPLLDLLRTRGDEIAAVLISLPYNRVVSRDFLFSLRDACHARDVRFILDEVVTGFRLARGGAQEFYDIRADYVCLSKGLAAGMPLSAVVGPRRALEPMQALQVSTTFGGEMLSLEVCRATLAQYRDTDHVERTSALGARLKTGVNRLAEANGYPLRVLGYDPIPFFLFAADPDVHVSMAEPFVGAMARRGVLLRRDVSFLSGAHTEAQIDFTLRAVEGALAELRQRGVFDPAPDLEVRA